MESSFRKLRIQFLRAELELRRLNCQSLASKFERRPLAYEERAELLHRWEDALKESQLLQALLDMVERDEKQASQKGMSASAPEGSQQFTFFTWFYHDKDRTRTS